MRSVLKHGVWALALLWSWTAQAAAPVEWQYTTLNGQQSQLSDHRGKWVVVNFWATWCPPCLIEIPELVMFQEMHEDTAVVLGVNLEDISTPRLKSKVEELLINYPVIVQGLDKETPFGRVPHMPTTILLAPDGTVAMRQSGSITMETLESYID